MKLFIAFLMTFIAGPVVFWLLARRHRTSSYVRVLWINAFILVVFAFIITRWIGPGFSGSALPGLAAVVAMWLSWIVVVVLCVQAVQKHATSDTFSKIAFVIGAMATTLPWFGLYAALKITA